ncbi:MAG: glycosyltransferase [Bdellovibrionales bacterium]|nr:glycosyltransferase [Bdellovibrionales bacterium]
MITLFFILIAAFGVSAMTWLFPWVASRSVPKVVPIRPAAPEKVSRFSIIVPAHNEEATIVQTLTSIQAAISALKSVRPEIEVEVLLGADGCHDRTVQLAKAFPVQIFEANPGQGKWKTINQLVAKTEKSNWIVLADAGIIWPANFLVESVVQCEKSGVVGLSPTYRNPSAGKVEEAIWNLETWLKAMENQAGGPVSVHGASVLYRRKELVEALEHLGSMSSHWLNDDVAIAMSIRLRHPESKIVYLTHLGTWDCPEAVGVGPVAKPVREFARRKRMVIGNLQWIRSILLKDWARNEVAALVALRRVFRLLWAYWMVALVLATALIVGPVVSIIVSVCGLVAGVAVLGARPFQMLSDACLVSLLAPYYLVSGKGMSRWK